MARSSRVSVSFPPGAFALRRATVKLAPATIIRPREYDELTSAVKKSALLSHGRMTLAVRRLVLEKLAKRFTTLEGRSKGWTLALHHEAHRDRLVVRRSLVARRTKSAIPTLDRVVRDSPLKDPTVAVESRDGDGIETGYRITFTPTLNTGAKAFQSRVEESLATLAGKHVSGRQWVTEWHPDDGYLIMRLQAPLPRRVDHPWSWSTKTYGICRSAPAPQTSQCSGTSRRNRTNRTASSSAQQAEERPRSSAPCSPRQHAEASRSSASIRK